ncbi:thioredoxin domain-containing protein [Schaalia sp. HMT-877]|nr:hypothetical protein HMPREF1550_00448 [Actinomyces sp. oral taxon 877 str. F0543]WLD79871.1 thioredoxin domain-containing protein [Schaalia sp. HMT-877]
MGNKSAKKDAVRLKAQQMRQAQERADRRTRIIVISVVTVVVLAVVASVAYVILRQRAIIEEARNVDPASVLGDYADGRPIVVGPNGVGQADPSLPTLTEYFDYSCHACADTDAAIGAQLTQWAEQGRYNIEIQSVTTVGMEYQKAATSASLVVAQKDPDHWVAFHHALLAYFRTQFQASNGTVVQDLEASWRQVKTIASETGVPQDVVDTFPLNASDDYLKASTAAWQGANVAGRGSSLGTPEFVKDHARMIPLTSAAELQQSIDQAFTPGADGSAPQSGAQEDTAAQSSGDAGHAAQSGAQQEDAAAEE